MASLSGYYLNPHVSQYDGSYRQNSNCCPASAANGANASTGGAVNRNGASVRSLLKPSEETTPGGGWSIWDIDKAMGKIGVPYVNYSQTGRSSSAGWELLKDLLDLGHYVTLQGDSDQFGNHTCSGKFDGDHCIGIHPARRLLPSKPGVAGGWQRYIDDPICEEGRWEYESVLYRYAVDYNSSIRFGAFGNKVPRLASTHRVVIEAKARIRLYTLNGSCISTWTDRVWGNKDSSAPSAGPVYRRTCSGKSGATTALVADGAFTGRYIRVGAQYGVTIERV